MNVIMRETFCKCALLKMYLIKTQIVYELAAEAWMIKHSSWFNGIQENALGGPGSSLLTLKVLNFWKFTSYCSLKPLWLGMGKVVSARTSPALHPPSSPIVHQLLWLAL